MDPMLGMSLLGMGLNVGGGLLGQWLSSADSEEALRYRKEALANYMGISVPALEEMVAQQQGPTNLAGVTTDPSLEAYQEESQQRLADIARSGGMDARSRARMEQARMQAAQSERASREGVLANARARGTLGSGEELSALLQAGQASADRERMAGVQTLSDAESRALDAIMASGSMAGQRQARQWDQRAQVASAQDAIDRFNTATSNEFTMANAQQRQMNFQNQMSLADRRAAGQRDMAGYYDNRANNTRQMWGGLGQAAGFGAGSVGQYMGMGGGGPGGQQTSAYASPGPGAIGSAAAPDPKRRGVR